MPCLDGRSFPSVLREVFACYESCVHGKDAALPLPARIATTSSGCAIRSRGRQALLATALAGFRAPTPLVVARERDAAPSRDPIAEPMKSVCRLRLPPPCKCERVRRP